MPIFDNKRWYYYRLRNREYSFAHCFDKLGDYGMIIAKCGVRFYSETAIAAESNDNLKNTIRRCRKCENVLNENITEN